MTGGSKEVVKIQVGKHKKMKTVHEAVAFIGRSINTFEYDPPDSEFQRGYLEALLITRDALQQAADGKLRGWHIEAYTRYKPPRNLR